MKITGVLADVLLKMDAEIFKGYVLYEKVKKFIYVVLLRTIYGRLFASLLWYQKFKKDLKSVGFVLNNYDPCVSNMIVDEKQHTV